MKIQRILCLLAACLLALPAAALADLPEHPVVNGLVQPVSVPTADEHTLVISMVGDCAVAEQYRYRGYKTGYVYNIGLLGLDYPMRNVAQLFAEDDLTIANCECVFTRRRLPADGKDMSLSGDPDLAQVLAYGNVDICNLSNNHTGDFGEKGKDDTKAALEAVGINWYDHLNTRIIEIKGVKIGITGTTFPLSDRKIQAMIDRLNRLKEEEGVTFTIASVHWGHEDSRSIDSEQRKYGRRMIDAGVDMVYGHGSHTLQPVQYYKGRLIFYSTSNFTFGGNRTPKDSDTAVFQVTLDIGEDHSLTLRSLQCLPFRMYGMGAPDLETGAADGLPDFSPVPVEDEAERRAIFAKLVLRDGSGLDSNLPLSFDETGFADFTA